jgi:hypothetical protein
MTPDEAKFILWNSRREAAQPASEQVGTDEPSGEGVNPNPDLQELLGRLRAADLDAIREAEKLLISQAADLARKDAALRPFADFAEWAVSANDPDDQPLKFILKAGDLRAARQALETKAGGAS